jgi:hypothetical protein
VHFRNSLTFIPAEAFANSAILVSPEDFNIQAKNFLKNAGSFFKELEASNSFDGF